MEDSVKKIYHIMNACDHNDRAGKREYCVKSYQRGYRWGIYQIDCLLNDIYLNYQKYYDKLNGKTTDKTGYEYCLQPLVVNQLECSEKGLKKYSVIDGQQRLTTLSLIFKALNRLQNSDTNGKQDEIAISYDRAETKGILEGISVRCQKIENFSVENLTHTELVNMFEDKNKQNAELNHIIEEAGMDTNIDGKFMVNAYIYLFLYFKIIINSPNTKDSYFGFTGAEDDEMTDYGKERIKKLQDLYKFYTTIIWYDPISSLSNKVVEEDVFENFNARKIPLTKSELTKALFMNPENYIKAGQEYNSEAIKTRQILIGNKWDDIEKELHTEELWHFYPHYDSWHNQTRFDAIIDYFVYCNYEEKEGSITDKDLKINFETDPLFSFKMLDKWIKKDLDPATSSSEKADIMKRWWHDICAIYDSFAMFMEPDKKMIRCFHRISLIQWMENGYFSKITRGNNVDGYLSRLSVCKKIYDSINKTGNNDIEHNLNKKITERIKEFFAKPKISHIFETPDGLVSVNREACKEDIAKIIKALSFNSDNLLIETFLIIFSLQILEKNPGIVSRFSFYQYSLKEKTGNKEDWILEHIFARKTSLKPNKSNDNATITKEMINEIINSDWKEYVEFKFSDILDSEDIDKIIARKQHLVKLLNEGLKDNSILDHPEIFDVNDSYGADYINPIPEIDNDFNCLLVELLKDNSMGNMAILSRRENSAVANNSYAEKKQIIIDKINNGNFVPVATVNMFTGTYCKKGYSTEIWYPCHRKIYLEEMIKAIGEYLEEGSL